MHDYSGAWLQAEAAAWQVMVLSHPFPEDYLKAGIRGRLDRGAERGSQGQSATPTDTTDRFGGDLMEFLYSLPNQATTPTDEYKNWSWGQARPGKLPPMTRKELA